MSDERVFSAGFVFCLLLTSLFVLFFKGCTDLGEVRPADYVAARSLAAASPEAKAAHDAAIKDGNLLWFEFCGVRDAYNAAAEKAHRKAIAEGKEAGR